jgi:hypothetical protein
LQHQVEALRDFPKITNTRKPGKPGFFVGVGH